MIARYPGRCARTGAAIRPGDAITPMGRKRYALAQHAAPVSDPVDMLDPELAQLDPEAAAAAGRYLRQSMARSVSSLWRGADGREYYRNKRGRCEDAPCCGCCNA
jgi:hypothetical protein